MVGQPIIDKPACASALEPATTHTDAYELVFHANDAAEHGVQSTWGRRRVFRPFSGLKLDSGKVAFSHPTPSG